MDIPRLPQRTKGAPVIRRYVTPLVACAVAAAVLIASSPADAGGRRMALGVWIPDGNRTPSVYDAFANEVGRRPAVVTMSAQWGEPDTKKFPMAEAKHARRKGSAVMITWTPTVTPISKETGKYARFKRIVNGKHDRYIKNFARAVKRFGGPVWIRPFHEANTTFFPWTAGWGKFYNPATGRRDRKNDNTRKLYKKAFNRVYDLFQKVGAKNAKFMFTLGKKRCTGGCDPYKAWKPKRFHYAGFSTFNWGGYSGRPHDSFVGGMKQPMRNFLRFTKKPIVVAELGTTPSTSPGGVTKSEWLANGYPAVFKKYRRVKAVIYQHVDNRGAAHGHPNWHLNDPPGSINAYKDLLTKTKFRGKVNKKGVVY